MKFCLLLCLFIGLLSRGAAQPLSWQQKVDYSIYVTLNDTLHTLNGFIKIKYQNQSPDTLSHLWFHLSPNAYKNDQTALSKQMLQNYDTRFYFSSPGQKGYINQLDFRVNNVRADVESHSSHIDIVNLILPKPLLPGEETVITTPFHVQLPAYFNGNGHKGQSYQIAAWYPQPAVYDSKGWHPMPYRYPNALYAEAGNFDVTITLPDNYVVLANGALQTQQEKEWLNTRSTFHWEARRYRKKMKRGQYMMIREEFPVSSTAKKTIRFRQENSTHFTWYADKRYTVHHDTCVLASGKTINLYTAFTSPSREMWKNSIVQLKESVRVFSATYEEYPFSTLSIAESPAGANRSRAALKYLNSYADSAAVAFFIASKLGQIWFNELLAPNTRTHPWMAKGFTSFYLHQNSPAQTKKHSLAEVSQIALSSEIAVNKDQPVDLPATAFSAANFYLSAGTKAAQWIQLLENNLGKATFDSSMRVYFRQWQFRHPYPEDFKRTMSEVSGKNLDSIFQLLNSRGSLSLPVKKRTRLAWIAKTNQQYLHVGVAPAIGFNQYDKLMAGAVFHNYSLPFPRFRFIAVPLYATGSKQFNGIGRATYSWYPEKTFDRIDAGLSIARFTEGDFTDEENKTTFLRYLKFSPQIRLSFHNPNPLSSLSRFVQLKAHIINTSSLQFTWDSVSMKNQVSVTTGTTPLIQLRFVTQNSRALYPYRYALSLELSRDFGKMTYTGNYFFNYAKGGGVNLRWFAGKFFYLGDNTPHKQAETSPYHLNMSTPKGYEDYTYENYFLGRNAYNGFASQQVMMRDGGFKARTDLLSRKVGKTDNWLAALNFTTTIHPAVPVKFFLDLGTYHQDRGEGTDQPALLYDAGLQLSLCRDIFHVYVPLLYSKVYRNYYRSTPGNSFLQRISFSIDIQDINFKRINPLIPF